MRYKNVLKNKTFTYIFPMIASIINYHDNLLACYLGDVDKPEYNNHILLKYKFNGSLNNAYLKFEEEIQKCTLFEAMYDIKDGIGDTVMFVFKVPKEYQDDYNIFVQSKYSKMSDEYKKKILTFHDSKHKSMLEGILYKTKEYYEKLNSKLRNLDDNKSPLTPDMEFSSKWEREHEYFELKVVNVL